MPAQINSISTTNHNQLQRAHTVFVYQKHLATEEKSKEVPSTIVSQELFRARGNWLFDLMPDELIITEKLITIRNNYFPFGNFVSSVSIDNVRVVQVSHSLIFSTIYIKGINSEGVNIMFKWLSRKTAQKAKSIIDGLRIVRNNDITILQSDKKELVNILAEIGRND